MESVDIQPYVKAIAVELKSQYSGLFNHTPSIWEGNPIVVGVFCLLILLLTFVIFVFFYKWLHLSRARRSSRKFLDVFWASKRLDAIYNQAEMFKSSPLSQVFKAGYIELSKLKSQESKRAENEINPGDGMENVDRALRRATAQEETHLEHMVGSLATIGSAAPFIGLFGTVIGIINAFEELKHVSKAQGAMLDIVGPGISEALWATAFGLAAAIPAVMAYNWFTNKIRVISTEMSNFSHDFLNILKRHFFSK